MVRSLRALVRNSILQWSTTLEITHIDKISRPGLVPSGLVYKNQSGYES